MFLIKKVGLFSGILQLCCECVWDCVPLSCVCSPVVKGARWAGQKVAPGPAPGSEGAQHGLPVPGKLQPLQGSHQAGPAPAEAGHGAMESGLAGRSPVRLRPHMTLWPRVAARHCQTVSPTTERTVALWWPSLCFGFHKKGLRTQYSVNERAEHIRVHVPPLGAVPLVQV